MAPAGVEPAHADSKSAALSTELRGRFCQSSGVETETAARRWVDGWSRAWPAADADAVAALYADDARFRSQPFREPQDPHAYAEWAFSEQDEAECRFAEPIVVGDRAIVEYWAVLRFQGEDETIAGVAVIRFRPDGLVAEQHDYWNTQAGRIEPPEGWGR
jgi:ketosteroid isomerase-like protein